ncbi:MAG: hypothetical protein ACYSWO_12990 [Planctomycetota bacterium]|jgi:hypothetical protein
MKRKIIIACLLVVVAILAVAGALVFWAASVPVYQDDPDLRAELEQVYGRYLQSISDEDANALLSTLTSARIADMSKTFELNQMKFPDDYFTVFKKYSPRLPPTKHFQYVAVTQGDKYANLIYVGNMNGYLRETQDAQRFLVIQFEKENGDWKYSVIVDPPASLVPHLEDRLRDGRLYFLRFKPFVPEKIELIP